MTKMARLIFVITLFMPPIFCLADGNAAEPINLTFADFFPKSHTISVMVQTWCKEVEARTGGRVKVKYFAGGSLTKPKVIYEGVVDGLSDLGQSVLAYTPGKFPVMDTVGLPLGYTSGAVATGVVNEVYRHFKPKEFADTEVMYLHAHGPGFIHTNGVPVRRLENLKGLKIRSHGTSALVVEALGGKVVHSTIGQVYEMAKSGVINGASHPYEADLGFKLAEVFDHVTVAYPIAYTSPMFVVMNKKRWKSLPNDIKRIIREINNEWMVQHGEAWNSIDRAGVRAFLNRGNQIIGLSEAESARWKAAVDPIIEDYVVYLSGKGLNGREIVDFTIKTLHSMQ